MLCYFQFLTFSINSLAEDVMDPEKICTFCSWFLKNVKHGSPTMAC
jgi:hypothetical protein